MPPTDPIPLPDALARRCLRHGEVREGELVICWLRVAVRGHENPALDVARLAAAALDRPLLVYHAVSERYPHASDRHHQFILEGARDLAAELDGLGLASAFHVERPGHRGPVLAQLAERAALVLTDAMPLDPLRRWTARLAERAPVWEVDSSCLAPITALAGPPTRAFSFRRDSAPHRGTFEWPWPQLDVAVAPYEGPLPFEPVDPRTADLRELVGACAIDHRVAPVADTRGGSVAGYARWSAFVDDGLKRYPKTRNDAARPDGVSRMSAYLHYGHVSPFRLAREASARGASKWLDELLTWRELAWHFCHHHPSPRSVEALPEWARRTLEDHRSDPRELLPLEALEEARTGDPLWDATQRSLVRHGELHNNVRMTWGKAVLGWSRGPRQTLARLFELNDRYALDGRDPASVGGILWCLGGLDRPFSPETSVFGKVRTRSSEAHARRLDLDAYQRHVTRPIAAAVPRVLVIGAGVAGATVGASLARVGVPVEVLEKSRGPGGRTSSRRSEEGRYDHGAPSFTARDPRFVRQVRIWEAAGVTAPWQGSLGRFDGGLEPDEPRSPRWVVVPRMSLLPRHLLADVPLHTGARVVRLEREGSTWRAHAEDGRVWTAERVVLTAPAPQAEALLRPVLPELADQLARVEVAPCWAAMIRASTGLDLDAIRGSVGPLSWLARQDRLPGREGPERWVAHASSDWSTEHLEDEPERVEALLSEAFAQVTGTVPDAIRVHRWRYSRVTRPLGVDTLAADGLIVAGDGCLGGRVEAAWLSGCAAAGEVLRDAVGT